jgi:hypothetical protein
VASEAYFFIQPCRPQHLAVYLVFWHSEILTSLTTIFGAILTDSLTAMGFPFRSKPEEVVMTEKPQTGPEATTSDASDNSNTKDEGVSACTEGLQVIDEESISKDTQAGVQKIQAATSVWSKGHLVAAYAL